jgi:hypothetical protein
LRRYTGSTGLPGPEHVEEFVRASETALAAVRDRFGPE